MKWTRFVENRMQNLSAAIRRFPLTGLFLILAAGITAMSIQLEKFEEYEWVLTGFVGALSSAVAQLLYERFFRDKSKIRLLFFLAAIVLAGLFYVVIKMGGDLFTQRVYLRTIVLSFSLFIALIWVPTIRHPKLVFSDSFTAAFKALFTTFLFSVVLMVGITVILSAISALLAQVDYRFYTHTANIIGTLFAPLFFLASIPKYPLPNEKKVTVEVQTSISISKMLNILLTYIVIPIVMIFTIILALYIFMNIGQDFWTNNLLEPMLVTYSITVILVMLLIGRLNNKIVNSFRLIFPKVLFFIVLLQTIASVIQIGEKGLTVGRYYVILFGIFSIIASLIFSIWPKQKNGLVAVVLIAFSAISIIPPVDAFTVSKKGQIAFLSSVLKDNQMLENGQIVPRSDLPSGEQQKIVTTIMDLEQLEAFDEISFLPENYPQSATFEETFGFEAFAGPGEEFIYYSFDWSNDVALNITDYAAMTKIQVDAMVQGGELSREQPVEIDGEAYQVVVEEEDQNYTLSLRKSTGEVLIQKDLTEIFNELDSLSQMNMQDLTLEHAFSHEENTAAVMDLVLLQANRDETTTNFYLEAFVFIDVK